MSGESASRKIDERIAELDDWRGEKLSEIRRMILTADPELVEEWKWMGTPTWSRGGVVAVANAHKDKVRITFAHGAELADPKRLFNTGLDGSTRRAIDLFEGDTIDAAAFGALVRQAVDYNATGPTRPVLLSGGNPQIKKADGDTPVQAYIAAMPGWKSEVGRRLDALIESTVPDVRKAVRWNSPFYGVEGQGWFLNCHVFTRHVKVTFLRGASLDPMPPLSGKDPDARWVNIGEGEFNEAQLETWIRQAAAIPGWPGFDTL
ncbi:MAG: DUF1801 domain-containing protein [Acidimicrobiia bacterium]|nr:DUF1801 domain-containing protein [Acidimicrobiia bacterium]MYB79633.1 DUF1801 domain-containing protein [Acidimicrobiia bacterium]MYD40137.1 DUF1801 domain-containing protein [Acidimicrobiia bacterium]